MLKKRNITRVQLTKNAIDIKKYHFARTKQMKKHNKYECT